MRWLAFALLLGTLASVPGCGRQPTAELMWAQWLTFREIEDMAVGPDGSVVVVGRETADVWGWASPKPRRPFILRIDPDGERTWDRLEYEGSRTAVAVDEQGRPYSAVARWLDHDDPDAAYWIPARHDAYLESRDERGELRWEHRFVGDDGSVRDVYDLQVVGDTLLAATGNAVHGLDFDGDTKWVAARDFGTRAAWALDDEAAWVVDIHAEEDLWEVFALRYDATTGTRERIVLETRRMRPTAARRDGAELVVVLRDDSGEIRDRQVELAAYDLDGQRRWSRRYSPGELPGSTGDATSFFGPAPPLAVLPARGGHWLVGNDWRDITATEREDDPLFYVNQHRFWLQYVDRNGTPGARLRRTFSEDPQDPIARRDDEFSDVVGEPRDGSGVSFARAIGDAYVLAGVQGRRDAFVLRMEQRQ